MSSANRAKDPGVPNSSCRKSGFGGSAFAAIVESPTDIPWKWFPNFKLMDRRERGVVTEEDPLNARVDRDLAAVYGAVVGEMRAGRLLEAQARCRRALEANPQHPELLHLMALVGFNAGQFDHAVEWAARDQEGTEAHLSDDLGTAL
jgi:tetratricopeptide (TPR) repeat protein